ncbi:MAG TPA: winged helix-turn-helix domain-containing protein [Allosphingosinicella sp.]|nr:winged helix-turn-helix domain-containing protein [Allosphingosinicella sp.]
MTRFGQVEFDAARGALSVAGQRVPLDRSSLAILEMLLAEAGKEVDKDRLLEAGWPARVVHENSLAKAIGRLRCALGRDGGALETVHGYGYRLAVDPEVGSLPQPARRRFGRFGLGLAAGAGALGLGAVAAVALGAFSRAPEAEPPLVRGEPANALGRILWVDDNPQNNAREKQHLERNGIAVYQIRTSEEALALLAMYEYRAVISDMNRNGRPLDGLDLVREMRRRNDRTPFFLYTVVPSAAQRAQLTRAGGQGATVTPNELYAAVLPLFRAGAARPAR